ncbi:hypothetical protein B0T20DRAFT_388316 [Sordaria brevicollis]|uniref:Uncharacterized protein n=1 Tax=Sordaria brevicollis TaxID=83679 RepID=A0AAE0PMT5_SORBR|nr:hypothetical protein B0T20DRAFT_388316 [Sordaria brevicollis]
MPCLHLKGAATVVMSLKVGPIAANDWTSRRRRSAKYTSLPSSSSSSKPVFFPAVRQQPQEKHLIDSKASLPPTKRLSHKEQTKPKTCCMFSTTSRWAQRPWLWPALFALWLACGFYLSWSGDAGRWSLTSGSIRGEAEDGTFCEGWLVGSDGAPDRDVLESDRPSPCAEFLSCDFSSPPSWWPGGYTTRSTSGSSYDVGDGGGSDARQKHQVVVVHNHNVSRLVVLELELSDLVCYRERGMLVILNSKNDQALVRRRGWKRDPKNGELLAGGGCVSRRPSVSFCVGVEEKLDSEEFEEKEEKEEKKKSEAKDEGPQTTSWTMYKNNKPLTRRTMRCLISKSPSVPPLDRNAAPSPIAGRVMKSEEQHQTNHFLNHVLECSRAGNLVFGVGLFKEIFEACMESGSAIYLVDLEGVPSVYHFCGQRMCFEGACQESEC